MEHAIQRRVFVKKLQILDSVDESDFFKVKNSVRIL